MIPVRTTQNEQLNDIHENTLKTVSKDILY